VVRGSVQEERRHARAVPFPLAAQRLRELAADEEPVEPLRGAGAGGLAQQVIREPFLVVAAGGGVRPPESAHVRADDLKAIGQQWIRRCQAYQCCGQP
jgi:hypothetical protein